MGYRSNVAYKIVFSDAEQFNVFLIEAKSKPETRLCFEDEDLVVAYDKQEIRFLAEAVKWYPDYPDVKCHHKLFELCDEYNQRQEERFIDTKEVSITPPTVSYLFRRIGESEDDYEDMHGGDPDWDWVYVSRQLVVDWA